MKQKQDYLDLTTQDVDAFAHLLKNNPEYNECFTNYFFYLGIGQSKAAMKCKRKMAKLEKDFIKMSNQ